GKLDKRSLLEIDASINQDSYVAPRNELADELCKLYAEVLGLEQVGITDDFFRVGGNSILAIQLSHKVSKALSVDVKVADIFQYRTVKTISGYIVQDAHSSIVIPKVEQSEYVLSFAQERLWFIEQYEQGTNAYHIPMVVELLADTDIKVLEQALEAIANRHQVLKSVFKINDAGQDVQIIGRAPLSIITKSYIDKEKLNLQIQEDINRVFDLRASYPIRVVSYIQENNAEQGSKQDNEPKRYLLINIHHIAFDGWSTDILLKELNQIYNNLKVGKVTYAGLNELSIQYKDFALWQREFLHGEILSEQVDYWKGRLDGIEPLALPLDYPRPHQIDYTGDNIDFSLDKQLSDSLIQFTKEKGYTLYSTLLTAFYILLNKYTSQEDIVIGTPIANRHYAQIEDLIGFFVNSLALPQHVHSEATVGELFEQVHERLIEAQCYQDIPFEKLVEALKVERDQRS
uniref:condensation domain-containing protein n=1 Tax=Cysteiniphilum litorale TaxID=2056700 RepID=UPI003F882F47